MAVQGRRARDAAGADAAARRSRAASAWPARRKAALAQLAKDNWTAKRAQLAERIEGRRGAKPIDPDWLTLQIANALPRDAVLVNEGLTSARHITDLVPYRDRYSFHALASGGIGWGLPAAVGVAFAQAPRPVCCFSGDGSAMYSIQSLWTAANAKLPITYVIANNGGYRIIKQRLKSFHGSDRLRRHGFRGPQDRLHGAGASRSACRPSASASPMPWRRPCSGPSRRRARSYLTFLSMGASSGFLKGGGTLEGLATDEFHYRCDRLLLDPVVPMVMEGPAGRNRYVGLTALDHRRHLLGQREAGQAVVDVYNARSAASRSSCPSHAP